MVINICGVPHTVEYTEDNFPIDLHLGSIDFAKAAIHINKEATETVRKEALYHEIVHAIFVHIGRNDLTDDETLVQSLANALLSTFELKEAEKQ